MEGQTDSRRDPQTHSVTRRKTAPACR